jgi:hypothetical protein
VNQNEYRTISNGVIAAIAMTGLKIALQMPPLSLYDTRGSESRWESTLSTVMDEFPGDAPSAASPLDVPAGVESTFDLLARAKAGDREATERLFTRFLPQLRRWASGRLPRWARDLMDTDDLVQETIIRALKRIDSFESRHDGALQAYLRQAIVNRIRDEVRRTKRWPASTEAIRLSTLRSVTKPSSVMRQRWLACGQRNAKRLWRVSSWTAVIRPWPPRLASHPLTRRAWL